MIAEVGDDVPLGGEGGIEEGGVELGFDRGRRGVVVHDVLCSTKSPLKGAVTAAKWAVELPTVCHSQRLNCENGGNRKEFPELLAKQPKHSGDHVEDILRLC